MITPLRGRRRRSQWTQRLGFALLTLSAIITTIPIVMIIFVILQRGLAAITPEFLFAFPTDGLKAGGIFPAILGTVYLTLLMTLAVAPLGIAAGVYLAHYAPATPVTRWIRVAILNLAGIPSVVYGLFGLAFFVIFMQFGTSILAGALTLAIMTLPVVITTTEEALRSVPNSFHVVSVSLGGTDWQSVRRLLLPQGLPGILTGVILGLERAAGETAPILFTAAAVYLPRLPTSPLDPTMALPYHLYVVSTQVPGMPPGIQFGTAAVLLILVLAMNLIATIIRSRARARRMW
ncbi:MAG TPA: phosphate ABC transporter permease PstA [Anaerolineales bacterium]|nr:phosphate ABC transporter permease PstA [Anaerolineales bacterium]